MNRLTWVQRNEDQARFVYDGLGRCLKRTVSWETILITYDGWKPIVEWGEWGFQKAWNVYGAGPDEILWRYADSSDHLRYHSDRMGNVAFLLDFNGAVVEKYTYDAFGLPTVTDANGENPRPYSWYGNRFMFTGREYFPELGLYDYRNRFYDPILGRFVQSDPIGFAPGDANLFRYCAGDPVNSADPFGLSGTLTLYSDRGHGGLTGGHLWIGYVPDSTGVRSTYSTFSNLPERNGLVINADLSRDTNLSTVSSISTWINNQQERQLMSFIAAMQSIGDSAWHWATPCSNFAAFAWFNATGMRVNDRAGFFSTPTALANSIDKANKKKDQKNNTGTSGRGSGGESGSPNTASSGSPGAMTHVTVGIYLNTTFGSPAYNAFVAAFPGAMVVPGHTSNPSGGIPAGGGSTTQEKIYKKK